MFFINWLRRKNRLPGQRHSVGSGRLFFSKGFSKGEGLREVILVIHHTDAFPHHVSHFVNDYWITFLFQDFAQVDGERIPCGGHDFEVDEIDDQAEHFRVGENGRVEGAELLRRINLEANR